MTHLTNHEMPKVKAISERICFLMLLGLISIGSVACQGDTATDASDADMNESDTIAEISDLSNVDPTVPVVVATVVPQDFQELIEVTGTVEAMNDVVVSAEAGGRIQWLKPLGSFVGRGAMIARMDDRVVQSSYDAAKSQYDLSEDTFLRQQALYADSIISSLEFQSVRAQRDQAKAMLAQAEKVLSDARPSSPFSGTVQEHITKVGSFVAPGSPIARIVDTRSVKIRAGIPERYAGDLKSGTKAKVIIQGNDSEPKEGRISFISDVVDPGNRTFDVEIKLDNRAGKVKPAMVTKVAIEKNTIRESLVVPRGSIVSDELGDAVFVVREEGDALVARRIVVELGPSLGNETVVENGLNSGDQIIVVGQKKITDGVKVELSSTDQ